MKNKGKSEDEKVDGSGIAANILKRLSPEHQERLVKAISHKAPQIAAKLEERMYNFDSLSAVADETLQALMREVSPRDIAISLKATPESLKEKILENLSETKQRIIEDDLESLPPMRLGDVHAAQKRILRKLEDMYELDIPVPTRVPGKPGRVA